MAKKKTCIPAENEPDLLVITHITTKNLDKQTMIDNASTDLYIGEKDLLDAINDDPELANTLNGRTIIRYKAVEKFELRRDWHFAAV